MLLGQPRKFVMEHAYWGAKYSAEAVRAPIKATGRPYQYLDDPEKLAELMVDDLLNGKVISLFQDRFE